MDYSIRVGIKGSGLPTGTTGAIGELRVAVDLMQRGFEVFRAISPSCSCDLAVLHAGGLLRIEVRTGYKNKSTGKIVTNTPRNPDRYDVHAIVVGDSVTYIPEDVLAGLGPRRQTTINANVGKTDES